MKWFKLNSDYIDDDKYQETFKILGYQGWIIWHTLIALLAKKYAGDPSTELEIYEEKFKKSCKISTQKLHKSLTKVAQIYNFSYTKVGEKLNFNYPKFMEIQQKYARDGGGKFVRNKKKNIEEDKERECTVKFSFEKVWEKYPKKMGRKAAERHFKTSIKTQQDFDNILLALNNYKTSKVFADGFVQNGSTWFNNWRDWLEVKKQLTNHDKQMEDLLREREECERGEHE